MIYQKLLKVRLVNVHRTITKYTSCFTKHKLVNFLFTIFLFLLKFYTKILLNLTALVLFYKLIKCKFIPLVPPVFWIYLGTDTFYTTF